MTDPDCVSRETRALRGRVTHSRGTVIIVSYKELQIAKWKTEGKPLPEGYDSDNPATVLASVAPTWTQV